MMSNSETMLKIRDLVLGKKTYKKGMSPKVGIFFFIDKSHILDAVPVETGEPPYGNVIQHGGHYEFWQSLLPHNLTERQFKARAYDAYPRGRVVYFPEKNCIYHDPCLKPDIDIRNVIEPFGLEGVEILN